MNVKWYFSCLWFNLFCSVLLSGRAAFKLRCFSRVLIRNTLQGESIISSLSWWPLESMDEMGYIGLLEIQINILLNDFCQYFFFFYFLSLCVTHWPTIPVMNYSVSLKAQQCKTEVFLLVPRTNKSWRNCLVTWARTRKGGSC